MRTMKTLYYELELLAFKNYRNTQQKLEEYKNVRFGKTSKKVPALSG